MSRPPTLTERPSPNGHAPPPTPPVAAKTISGRRALGMTLLIMAVGFGLANVYAFSQDWRQRERLVADGLRRPVGVVWMSDAALVVAEAGDAARPDSGRLTRAEASSGRQTIIDDLPSDRGGGPTGLARSPEGSLLITTGPCDRPRCRALLGPDAAGELIVLADLGARPEARGRSSPWGLAIGADGSAYVTDTGTGELLLIRRGGVPASVSTLARFGPDAAPHGVSLGPDGAAYVALLGAGSIARVAPDGGVTTVADGLSRPIAVDHDPQGRLLVLEHEPGRLVRVDGGVQPLSHSLDHPTGMVVVPDGRVYVTVRGLGTVDRPGQLLQIRRLGPVGPRRF